ncbi:hypothetical protein Avbf_11786 [Armadillidium vulgare]|nr:hypothetical protein Avbf_11786 [Armadillidium vulgare]
MAVRSPSTFGVLRSIPEPHTPPSMHARNTIGGIEEILENNMSNERTHHLQTFPQTSGIMSSSTSSGALASLGSSVRIPSVRFLNNNSSISSTIAHNNNNNNNNVYNGTMNVENNNGIHNNQRRLHLQPTLQNQSLILNHPNGEGFSNQTYGVSQPVSVISSSLAPTAGYCSASQIITTNSGIGEDRRLYRATKF